MTFQTKDHLSITAGLLNHMRAAQKRVTDFRVGAVARTVAEAAAVEIDELYQNLTTGLVDAIPASLYLGFGFPALGAAFAVARVKFTLSPVSGSDTTVAAATQVTNTGASQTYALLADVVILAGQTVGYGDVQATVAGVVGNLAAGGITTVVGGPAGVTVTNVFPVVSGADAETDTQRNLRFHAFLDALSRGPLASLEYGAALARLFDVPNTATSHRVVEARAVELYQAQPTSPLGVVDVYLYDGSAGASAALVARAQEILTGPYTDDAGNTNQPGFKAAGIRAKARAATVTVVNLTLDIKAVGGSLSAAAQATIIAEVGAAIQATKIGDTLYELAYTAPALRVAGVENCTSVTDDIVGLPGIKLVPGTITLAIT